MLGNNPDHVVNGFLAGHVSRRELIVRLMALGAGFGGVSRLAGASQGDGAAASPPTFTAKSIDHLALSVKDVERSSAWYRKHLGLTTMSASRTSTFLRCGNGRDFLALFQSDTPGTHHFSFGIEKYDQEDAAKRLRDVGLTPKLRGSRIYFDDPDRLEVQVSQD
jgi:catechol 2,3-dioxygenase-like lactoylglutathione lyase family enzyme